MDASEKVDEPSPYEGRCIDCGQLVDIRGAAHPSPCKPRKARPPWSAEQELQELRKRLQIHIDGMRRSAETSAHAQGEDYELGKAAAWREEAKLLAMELRMSRGRTGEEP